MGIVDICTLVILAIGALLGFKKGAIKGFVQLIGLVAIVILAFQFKGVIGNFLIDKMPFLNFGGKVDGLYSLNVLVYQGISFLIIFVLLYCILNIILGITGLIDLVVKFTIVFELPSKIIGTIIGIVESLVFVFVISFTLLQFSQTQKIIMDSQVTKAIVERTPIVNAVCAQTIVASEQIYQVIDDYQETKDADQANLEIIKYLIMYRVSDAKTIQKTIDNGKMHLDNVVVAS